MSKKRPNRAPTNMQNSRESATTHCISSTSPQKPAHLDETAGREWSRLVTERQGRPRTMSLRQETLLLTAAAQSYRYGVAIRDLAHRVGVTAAEVLPKEWRSSYAALCEALGCMPADPMLRDS